MASALLGTAGSYAETIDFVPNDERPEVRGVPPQHPNRADVNTQVIVHRGRVALKVFQPRAILSNANEMSDAERYVLVSKGQDRFGAEPGLYSKLPHPNIPRVIKGLHKVAGHPAFTMELLSGPSLAHLIQEGALTPSQIIKAMCEAADALHYAHNHAIIHRDINPRNIVFDEDGEAHVIDFGLGKDEGAKFQKSVTGEVLGTIDFISPEQAQDSKRVDHRTDNYSLGVTLYAAFGGKHLYPPDSPPITRLEAIRNGRAIDPHTLFDRLTSPFHGLVEVIARATRVDPSERYQTMSAFITALEPFRDLDSPEPRPGDAA